jgi:hypothetical protein
MQKLKGVPNEPNASAKGLHHAAKHSHGDGAQITQDDH